MYLCCFEWEGNKLFLNFQAFFFFFQGRRGREAFIEKYSERIDRAPGSLQEETRGPSQAFFKVTQELSVVNIYFVFSPLGTVL